MSRKGVLKIMANNLKLKDGTVWKGLLKSALRAGNREAILQEKKKHPSIQASILIQLVDLGYGSLLVICWRLRLLSINLSTYSFISTWESQLVLPCAENQPQAGWLDFSRIPVKCIATPPLD